MAHTHNISAQMPPLPKSWSELTWQQLFDCWHVKMRYGGNADVSRAAAFVTLLQLTIEEGASIIDERTGETRYFFLSPDGRRWSVAARELSCLAKSCLGWFDFPYGDPGKEAVKDEKGKVIEEAVAPVRGYVSGMRDAMMLPQERFNVQGSRFKIPHWFALPQAACANLTWEQYRALQSITPQLFSEDNTEEQSLELQAQFLAHILTPRSFAIFDTSSGNIKVRPHWVFEYDSRRAEQMAHWFQRQLSIANHQLPILFHLCFQVYQTALSYYAETYPLLFSDSGKQDPLKDALTGEVGTINTIMKYQGYSDPQAVYDANLPIILDVLNTMAKEAKEIEKMNARIKKK